jgi:hypothetical protein
MFAIVSREENGGLRSMIAREHVCLSFSCFLRFRKKRSGVDFLNTSKQPQFFGILQY